MFPRRDTPNFYQPYYQPQNQNTYQPYYQQPYFANQTKPRRGIFGNRTSKQQTFYPQSKYGYTPYPQLTQNQTNGHGFRDANGRLDFKKIGNGVQNVMGVVNQVSPLMGLFLK